MRTAKGIAKQVLRLSVFLDWQKIDKDGIRELTEALEKACQSDEHAKAVLDEWIRESTRLPYPADLYQLASRLKPETTGFAEPDYSCQICHGLGFETRWFLRGTVNGAMRNYRVTEEQAYELNRDHRVAEQGQTVISAAGRCSCPYGRHLQAAEDARDTR